MVGQPSQYKGCVTPPPEGCHNKDWGEWVSPSPDPPKIKKGWGARPPEVLDNNHWGASSPDPQSHMRVGWGEVRVGWGEVRMGWGEEKEVDQGSWGSEYDSLNLGLRERYLSQEDRYVQTWTWDRWEVFEEDRWSHDSFESYTTIDFLIHCDLHDQEMRDHVDHQHVGESGGTEVDGTEVEEG